MSTSHVALSSCKELNTCLLLGLYFNTLYTFLFKFLKKHPSLHRVHKIEPFYKENDQKIGINAELHYLHSTIKQTSVITLMKSLQQTDNPDNVLYEYLIGKQLNTFTQAPNVILTLNLLKYKSLEDYTDIVLNRKHSSLKQKLRIVNVSKASADIVRESCTHPKLFAIELLYVPHSIPLGYLFKNPKFVQYDLIIVMFQLYAFLRIYQHVFTHYDVHAANVLLFQIPDTYFTYVYTHEDGGSLTFDSPFLVKIIDYGRAYCSSISTSFRKLVCSQCTKCGYNNGYMFLPSKRNVSQDLHLLSMMHEIVQPYLKNAPYLKTFHYLSKQVQFTGTDRTNTPEITTLGTHKNRIHNIEDAYRTLWSCVERFPYKHIPNRIPNAKRYGTFRISTRVVKEHMRSSKKKTYTFVLD